MKIKFEIERYGDDGLIVEINRKPETSFSKKETTYKIGDMTLTHDEMVGLRAFLQHNL